MKLLVDAQLPARLVRKVNLGVVVDAFGAADLVELGPVAMVVHGLRGGRQP